MVDEGAAGLWKLLTGDVQQAEYQGPHYPNSTTDEISATFVRHCSGGCLYDLVADPLEAHDVAAAHPAVVQRLYARIEELERSAFNPDRGGVDPAACRDALGKYEGFWGPFLE